MSEPMWCSIKVKVPAAWIVDGKIPEMLNTSGLYNGEDTCVAEVNEDRAILFTDGEGNYGLLDEDVQSFLGFLMEHRIPHVAHCDPKYEMTGETYWYDGNEARDVEQREADGNGSTVFSEDQWLTLKNKSDAEIVAAVKSFFNVPELENCKIDHLPSTCPTDDDEENENDDDE